MLALRGDIPFGWTGTNGDLHFVYTADFTGCGIALGDLTDSTLASRLEAKLPARAVGTTVTPLASMSARASVAMASISGMTRCGRSSETTARNAARRTVRRVSSSGTPIPPC